MLHALRRAAGLRRRRRCCNRPRRCEPRATSTPACAALSAARRAGVRLGRAGRRRALTGCTAWTSDAALRPVLEAAGRRVAAAGPAARCIALNGAIYVADVAWLRRTRRFVGAGHGRLRDAGANARSTSTPLPIFEAFARPITRGRPCLSTPSRRDDRPRARSEADAPEVARYGLPLQVGFCRRCVISNQRPNSAVEFAHTKDSKKQTIHFDAEGVCDACRVAEQKHNDDRLGRARAQAARAVRPPSQQGRQLRLPRAGLRRQGQLLRRARAQVQVRHAPADGDVGAAHLHRVGLEELPGLDPRRLRQLPVHAQRPRAPAAHAAGGREPVPPVPAVHPRPEGAGAEDGAAARASRWCSTARTRPSTATRSPTRRRAKRDWSYFTAQDKSKIFLGGTSRRRSAGALRRRRTTTCSPTCRPIPSEIERQKVEVHYLGYYLKWHPQSCYYYAVEHGGFQASPERTPGTYSKYNSIDDRIDDFHYYTTLHQVRHRPRHLRRGAGDPLRRHHARRGRGAGAAASTASSRSASPRRSSAT